MAHSQKEMTKEGQFLRRSELNGRSIFVVDKSQNLMDTTIQMWTTFSFYAGMNRNRARWDRSTTTKT